MAYTSTTQLKAMIDALTVRINNLSNASSAADAALTERVTKLEAANTAQQAQIDALIAAAPPVTTPPPADTTAPVLKLPAADVTATATAATGIVVNFTVTATDNSGAAITPVVTPPSGSRFAPGTTTVTATATDPSGNKSSGSFKVVVTYVPPVTTPPPTGDLGLDGKVLPSPSNTGVPAGVSLTPYTGPMTITTAGTVIDAKTIPAGLVINAANVTVKRSRVTGGALNAIAFGNSGSGLIEDVEITCTASNQYDRSITRYNANTAQVIIRRVYAHGGIRGLDFTGGNHIRMEDCYMAFNSNPGSGERSHASAARLAGSVHHLDLINCVFGVGQGSWSSGLLATYPENGANHDITIQGGLWIAEADNGWPFGIAAGTSPGEPANYNYAVHNLYVSTQYYPEGCSGGILQQWGELTGTNSWSNIRKWNPGKPEHGQAFTNPAN